MKKIPNITTAPESYDGFGTETITVLGETERGDTVRLIYVDPNHLQWQQDRYRSGLYGSNAPEVFFEEYADWLMGEDAAVLARDHYEETMGPDLSECSTEYARQFTKEGTG